MFFMVDRFRLMTSWVKPCSSGLLMVSWYLRLLVVVVFLLLSKNTQNTRFAKVILSLANARRRLVPLARRSQLSSAPSARCLLAQECFCASLLSRARTETLLLPGLLFLAIHHLFPIFNTFCCNLPQLLCRHGLHKPVHHLHSIFGI